MDVFKGMILDVDGTLLDSNAAHAEAYARAMQEHGFSVRVEQIRPLIGMGADKLLPAAIGLAAESETGQRIRARKSELFLAEYLPHLQPTPGARPLLEYLRDADIVRIVASSAGADELARLLTAANVSDLVDDVASSDDVDDSKPDPDLVRIGLRKCALPARLVVMLGDTPYDLEAARGAGVRACALRCGGWADADLAGATAIFDDPADLLRELRATPLAAGVD